MRFIFRCILSLAINAAALIGANHFIAGFELQSSFEAIVTVAGLLTLINFFVRPILRLLLSPFIILTLGIGSLILNAFLLATLDYLSESLTITTFISLVYATIFITLINVIFHFLLDRLTKK